MTYREKLIELIREMENHPEKTCVHWKDEDCFNCPYDKGETCDMAARKADFLIANGVIVPPCKVGDELYAISDTRIMECTCYDMNIGNKVMICASFKCDYDCEGCPFNNWVQEYTGEYSCSGEYGDCFFEEDDFGKTVFLTRKEAEKALAERSANNA